MPISSPIRILFSILSLASRESIHFLISSTSKFRVAAEDKSESLSNALCSQTDM
jgi:hypothetical protein